MIRLHVRPKPGHPATTNTRGRTLTPEQPAAVTVLTGPACTPWTCTDPDLLDAAAAHLTDAARWLRDQQRPAPAVDPTTPTLFDQEPTP